MTTRNRNTASTGSEQNDTDWESTRSDQLVEWSMKRSTITKVYHSEGPLFQFRYWVSRKLAPPTFFANPLRARDSVPDPKWSTSKV